MILNLLIASCFFRVFRRGTNGLYHSESVELGVDTIVPVESARTIVKVKDKDGSGKSIAGQRLLWKLADRVDEVRL